LSLTIGDDAATSELTERLELASEPGLIDVPAEVANKEVLDTLITDVFRLGFLRGQFSVSLSLALLGGSLFLLAG
jgi:hypothetical protein